MIELDGHLYLAEMKWLKDRAGAGDVAQHLVRVHHRADMRGIFISASGVTDAAVTTCREGLASRLNVLCGLGELYLLLERDGDRREFFRAKVRAASIDRQPLFEPLSRWEHSPRAR